MIQLHVTNPDPNAIEVSSPRRMAFLVGHPPREMRILTGIAIPNWDSKSNLDYAEVLVHFNEDPPSENIDDWEYTATTSLAAINGTGDETTFATDDCSVMVDENTGELLLYTKIAVKGSPALLGRFSYHVEILSKIPAKGLIYGTISWAEIYGDPTEAVIEGNPMFQIGPAAVIGPALTWDPTYTVSTTVAPQKSAGEWLVPYRIPNLPMETPLTIVPKLMDGALIGPKDPPFRPFAVFTPVFPVVTLTSAVPSTELDFEMTFPVIG